MLTKEEGRKKLPEVIERFKRWKNEGRLNNEDDVKDLIYELSEKVLGWDRDDIYRERHPGPTSKRADFQFKDKGVTKLILETKAFNVSWDKTVIRQAIGYGWSSNKEYVILTNFQSLILFNAKWKDEDKKIFEIENIEDCLNFPDKFDRLWLLSKNSVLTGEIDRFSEDIGRKLKKYSISTIDKHLLNDLKKWREILTKDIKSLNKLPEHEVDEVVQKIINRVIFIRVCEDRGLEPGFAELRSHLNIWSEKRNKPLTDVINFVFHHYDDSYDSNIFQRKDICEEVQISNNILEKIIEELYIAKDVNIEYNFASIDADVLGSVYEEYLGYLLKGKKITENHTHRKEQGIYYTPTYIVDYIVRNTLGEILKNNKVKVEKIRVLDPACGSGSFLIKAFDVLNEYYSKNVKNYEQAQLDLKTGTTFTRKVNILKNNIFGVDLDNHAVEISRLNLLLKIAEKANKLPLLQENIKCGNSLIDEEKVAGDKAFKWEKEFKEKIDDGRFDIIIGNPPYDVLLTSQREKEFSNELKYLRNNRLYTCALGGRTNLFRFMVIRALNLLKKGGYFGFIIPLVIINDSSSADLRKFIIDNFQIMSIDCFPQKDDPNNRVFFQAKLSTCIIIVKNEKPTKDFIVRIYPGKDFSENHKEYKVSAEEIKQFDPDQYSIPMVSENEWEILKKLHLKRNFVTFQQIANSYQGEMNVTNYKKYFTENPKDLEMLKGVEIGRYRINKYIRQGKKEWFSKNEFEKIKNTFKRYSHIMQDRIATQQITGVDDRWRLKAVIIKSGTILANTTNYLLVKNKIDLKFICGILNSKLMDWRFRKTSTNNHINTYELNSLPFPLKYDSNQEKHIINLVEQMLLLNKKLVDMSDKITDERIKTEEGIKKIDGEINELIYKIYGITEEEQKIIKERDILGTRVGGTY